MHISGSNRSRIRRGSGCMGSERKANNFGRDAPSSGRLQYLRGNGLSRRTADHYRRRRRRLGEGGAVGGQGRRKVCFVAAQFALRLRGGSAASQGKCSVVIILLPKHYIIQMLAPRKVDRQAGGKAAAATPSPTPSSTTDNKQDGFYTRETRSGGRHMQDSSWNASGMSSGCLTVDKLLLTGQQRGEGAERPSSKVLQPPGGKSSILF